MPDTAGLGGTGRRARRPVPRDGADAPGGGPPRQSPAGRRLDGHDRWTSDGGSSSPAVSWRRTSGRQAPAGTSHCRSCTATGWRASSMRRRTRKPALLGIDATRQDIPVGKTTSAAVDRQPAAAVAHQLGGRQAARAVPHHRFLGAIIVGLVSWLLSITLCDKRPDREPSWPPFLTSAATGRSAGPPWPGPCGNSPHPG